MSVYVKLIGIIIDTNTSTTLRKKTVIICVHVRLVANATSVG